MDELERSPSGSGSAASSSHPPQTRLETLDPAGAIAMAERIAESRVFAGDAIDEARAFASRGERAAIVATTSDLAAHRVAMRAIAEARLGLVAHGLGSHGSEDLGALLDLGWGVLAAAGPEDAFDLSLVARRAAEDSGVPFLVVHALANENGAAGRGLSSVAVPTERAAAAFLGEKARLKPSTDPGHPSMATASDRAFAERAPFALGSALRDFAAVSGRRHDVFDKAPLAEAPLVLVGSGAVGDALVSAVAELRALGHEVSALNVSALRPFPGPRLVKVLARALAITVLEPEGEPLAHGSVLARELKSAFTDALTWAPGFPGIGRIPKLYTGVTGPSFDIKDLAAVCDNMIADERGRRSFSFTDTEHALPRPAADVLSTGPVGFRWVLDDAKTAEHAIRLTSTALATMLGVRVAAVLTPARSGEGVTVDLFAARDVSRGAMGRRSPRLVVTSAAGVARSDAITSLAPGGVLAVLGGGAAVPDGAKALVRERRARIVPLPTGDGGGAAVAAACASTAVAVASRTTRAAVDTSELGRAHGEHGELARRAFEAILEVLVAHERESNGGVSGEVKTAS